MSKRVLVTGASSGIGRSTAIEFASRGAEVVLTGRREDALAEVSGICGDKSSFVVADLASAQECVRLGALATAELGDRELVVVQAAGIAEFGDFAGMSIDSIEDQIRTNLMGPVYLTHAVLPTMLEARKGHLILVLSVAAEQVLAGSAAYSGSKAGLRMMAKVWAAESRRKGIRVTSILPGAVDTPIWQGGGPPKSDMLSAEAVAQLIADVGLSPADRSFDEILLMPPKGIL